MLVHPKTQMSATHFQSKISDARLNLSSSKPAVTLRPRGLQHLYSLNENIILSLGSTNSPSPATIAELGLTHVIRVEYETISHFLEKVVRYSPIRGSIRNERNESAKTDTLILTIPPPPPSPPAVKRTQTQLTPQQIAASRDFLNLALPFRKNQVNPTEPSNAEPDMARVLLVAPAWHVVRDTVASGELDRRDPKCYIDMGEEFDPCGPIWPEIPVEPPRKAELKIVGDDSAAADIIAIVVCYISYMTNANIGKVAKHLEEEMWMKAGRPGMARAVAQSAMFNTFKAHRTRSGDAMIGPIAKRTRFGAYIGPGCVESRRRTEYLAKSDELDTSQPSPCSSDSSSTASSQSTGSNSTTSHRRKPKYLDKRPAPILTSPSTPPRPNADKHLFLSTLSSLFLSASSTKLKPLPPSMSTTHASFWTDRIDGTGLGIVQTGLCADGRDPQAVAKLRAAGLDM